MKKNKLGLLSLLLALCLVTPLFSLAEVTPVATTAPAADDAAPAEEETPAEEPATDEATPVTATAAPAVPEVKFEFVKAAKGAVNKYYTVIKLNGIDEPVYAFTDKDGKTQLRVYGKVPDGKKGFYEAEVMVDDSGSDKTFTLSKVGEKPVKDSKVFAVYKGKNLAKDDIPEGFKKTGGKGVYSFFNLFGKKELVIWASMNDSDYQWYVAKSNKAATGALALNLDAINERIHQKDEKYYQIPKELKNGFAKTFDIVLVDGTTATATTNFPAIVKDELKER